MTLLALLPIAGRCQHLLDALALDDDRSVRVQDDDVTLTDRRAGDLDRLADRARGMLLRPSDADVARPDRETELTQLLDIADGTIHEDRRHATALGLCREEISDERDGGRLRHGQHEDLSGLRLRDGRVHHEVVVLAAAHGPRRPGGA